MLLGLNIRDLNKSEQVFFSRASLFVAPYWRRGGSRGRLPGVHTPPPQDDLRFSNTTGILQKRKQQTMWFIGVEVEQETSAPPPKKNSKSAPMTSHKNEEFKFQIYPFLNIRILNFGLSKHCESKCRLFPNTGILNSAYSRHSNSELCLSKHYNS